MRGDQEADRLAIDASLQFLRPLVRNRDTTKGIQYHFEDQAKYGALIQVLDMLDAVKTRVYSLRDNDIWVYNSGTARVLPIDTVKRIYELWNPGISESTAQSRSVEGPAQDAHGIICRKSKILPA